MTLFRSSQTVFESLYHVTGTPLVLNQMVLESLVSVGSGSNPLISYQNPIEVIYNVNTGINPLITYQNPVEVIYNVDSGINPLTVYQNPIQAIYNVDADLVVNQSIVEVLHEPPWCRYTPNADIQTGTWGPLPLWSGLQEEKAGSGYSIWNDVGQTGTGLTDAFEVSFPYVSGELNTGTPIVLRYSFAKVDNSGIASDGGQDFIINVTLYHTGEVVFTDVYDDVRYNEIPINRYLTTGELAKITVPTGLTISFVLTSGTVGDARAVGVDYIYLDKPCPPVQQTFNMPVEIVQTGEVLINNIFNIPTETILTIDDVYNIPIEVVQTGNLLVNNIFNIPVEILTTVNNITGGGPDPSGSSSLYNIPIEILNVGSDNSYNIPVDNSGAIPDTGEPLPPYTGTGCPPCSGFQPAVYTGDLEEWICNSGTIQGTTIIWLCPGIQRYEANGTIHHPRTYAVLGDKYCPRFRNQRYYWGNNSG